MKNFFKNLLVTILLGGGTIGTLIFLIGFIIVFFNGGIDELKSLDPLNGILLTVSFFGLLIGIFLVKKFGWKNTAYKILISYILTIGGFVALPFLIFALTNIFVNFPTAFETQKYLMIGIFVALVTFILGIFLTKKRKLQKQVYGFLAPIYIFLGGILLFLAAFGTNLIKFFPIPYFVGAIFGVIFLVLGILWIGEYQSGKTKGVLYFLGFGSLLGVVGLLISIFGFDKNPFVSQKPIILKNIDSKKFDFVAQNIPNNDNKKLSDFLKSVAYTSGDYKGARWQFMRYSGDYEYFSTTGLVSTSKKNDFGISEKYFYLNPYFSGQDFENYYQKNKKDFENLNNIFSGIDQKTSDIKTLVGSGFLSVYYDPSYDSKDQSNDFIDLQDFFRNTSMSSYENWVHGNKIDAKKKLATLNKISDQMLFIDSNLVRSLINILDKKLVYETIYNISILPNTNSEDKKYLNSLITPKDYHKIALDNIKYERLYILYFLDMFEKGDGVPEINGKKVDILKDAPSYIYDPVETRAIIDTSFAWIVCDINKKFGVNEKCEFSDIDINNLTPENLIYFPGGFLQRNFVGKNFALSMIPRIIGFSDQMKKLQDFETFLKNNLK